jgi:hypothetical protein
MYRKKKYVLGTVGAILRYLTMIPGVIFLLVGGTGILGILSGAAGEATEAKNPPLRNELIESGLAETTADDILKDGKYDGDKSKMEQRELDLVTRAEANPRYRNAAAQSARTVRAVLSLSLLFCVVLTVVGVVLMLVGWLIGIRKWKLICDQCGASVDAA